MASRRNLILGVLLLTLFCFAMGREFRAEAIPMNKRALGIDVNIGADGDYDRAVKMAIDAGAKSSGISLNWKDLEPSPRHYQDPNYLLNITNQYYPKVGLKIDLYIRAVDTTGPVLPKDLKKKKLSDPAVVTRYVKLMDYVFSILQNVEIHFLCIGNELTHAFKSDDAFWAEFTEFFTQVKAELKKKKPDLKIGASGVLDAMVGSHADVMKKLNEHTDVVLVSYYPLQYSDFSVKDAVEIHSFYDQLAEHYAGKTIFFSETGYPSSEILNSSEEKQAAFVEETFKAWDRHGEQIQYILFHTLHDLTEAETKNLYQYYKWSGPRFGAYLSTLGLLRSDGQPKKAHTQIAQEMRSRS